MKNNNHWRYINFWILILLIYFFLPSYVRADSTCNWQTIVTNGETTTSDNCGSGTTKTGDNFCPSPKPEGVSSHYICCCGAYVAPAKTTPPKFIMPDIQIPIPGLNLTPSSSIKIATNSDGSYSFSIPWISQYIIGLYNYGLAIAGILAAIMLMAGGLLWLISAGDASKVTQAKELITGSVTGLIILFSSYIILFQISPSLTQFTPITLGAISRLDYEFAKSKLGTTAEVYKAMACPSDAELQTGVQIYATGYFKMPFQTNQTLKYLCMVAMQGTCPKGINTGSTCVQNGTPIFPGYPNYQPCNTFTQDEYNKSYFSQANLIVGQTVAGPGNCTSNLPKGTKICFNGKTYTITDSGGGIKGRRIDILSSSESDAVNRTTLGTLKSGACQ